VIAALCGFLVQTDTAYKQIEGYIMIVCIMIYFLLAGVALSTVPYVLNAEVLPRSGISLTVCIQGIINGTSLYIFKILMVRTSVAVVLSILAVFNFLYLPLIWLYYRETKGLS
jgi:hypothetical protein